ncbi:hypothetical protein SCHPADRAFT_939977 [Schizopora paradoxa]|uniref:Coronin n=1 Tax=Schizopora paradoxa TaxID=27342 RepID=A0A0H2RPP6_9AGAM|nr:hypothetical protein SCHPADRAFT_939977 [Schizopora paradoxa]
MSGAQEVHAVRRAMRKSVMMQEKERKRVAKEGIDDGMGERTGHHRSNTVSSMAYSYSHGPQGVPPPRPASTSTTSRTHERRPTVSSQHTHVASPPPSYQTHTMMMTPTPYGVVPVTYAPYAGYGYPVYAPQPFLQQQRPHVPAPVIPPSTARPERRLSGSSGCSQHSRVSSRRSRARSRHGSDEGSIVPIPPEELPLDVKAAVSIEALNQAVLCHRIEWTAKHVLAGATGEHNVKLWDVGAPEDPKAVLTGHTDAVQSFAFNFMGNLLVTTCRDRKIRVFDSRAGGEPVRDRIATMRFSKMSSRELGIWNSGSLANLKNVTVDQTAGVLMPFYSDNNILYTFLQLVGGSLTSIPIPFPHPAGVDLAFPMRGSRRSHAPAAPGRAIQSHPDAAPVHSVAPWGGNAQLGIYSFRAGNR